MPMPVTSLSTIWLRKTFPATLEVGFGATGTWNIWDGGLTYGNVMQAKAQLMQAKEQLRQRRAADCPRCAAGDFQSPASAGDARQPDGERRAGNRGAAPFQRAFGCRRRHAARRLNAQVQLLQAQTNVLQARFDYIAAMASYDLALSLDTQYVETFDDPLVRPSIHRRSIAPSEIASKRSPDPKNPQPKLPRAFRKEDPIEPILEPAPSTSKQKKKRTSVRTGK